MIFPSASMNLYIWDQGSDPYSHTQLAANFTAIDQHDHSPGKGLQIGSSGIANNSITAGKIAAGAVGTSAIADNAVTSAKIGAGQVLSANIGAGQIHPVHLGSDVVFVPTGAVLPYAGSGLPTNFLFCDGSIVGQATYPNLFSTIGVTYNTGGEGGSNFRLPDLQTRIPVGKGVNDTTTLGQSDGGSAASRTWGHSHAVNSHAHGASHSHGINSEGPPTSFQGDHQHAFRSAIGKDLNVSQQYYLLKPEDTFMDALNGPESGSFVSQDNFSVVSSQNVYSLAPGVWSGTGVQVMLPSYQFTTGGGAHAHSVVPHSHGGATQVNNLVTDSQSPGTSSVRPNYIVLNYIIRT